MSYFKLYSLVALFLLAACGSEKKDPGNTQSTPQEPSQSFSGTYRGTQTGTFLALFPISGDVTVTLTDGGQGRINGTWVSSSTSGTVVGLVKNGNDFECSVIIPNTHLCNGALSGSGTLDGNKMVLKVSGATGCGTADVQLNLLRQ